MYFLYTWCTRECCNRLGRTPICRDSRINHIFRNTFPMSGNYIIPLTLGRRGKVYILSFGMHFLYTRGTRECCNRLGRTPICRDSRINHMFRNTFPMRGNYIIPLTLRRAGVGCTTSALVYTSCTRGVQENAAIGLVVLQSAKIL